MYHFTYMFTRVVQDLFRVLARSMWKKTFRAACFCSHPPGIMCTRNTPYCDVAFFFFMLGLEHQGTSSPELKLRTLHNPDSRVWTLRPRMYVTRSILHLILHVVTCQIFIGRVLEGNLSHTQNSSQIRACAYRFFSLVQLCTSDSTFQLVAVIVRRSRVYISAWN